MSNKLSNLVFEALGEASALFMIQDVKGTEIVMPTEDLKRIGDKLVCELVNNLPL